jgi:hypothetical protein
MAFITAIVLDPESSWFVNGNPKQTKDMQEHDWSRCASRRYFRTKAKAIRTIEGWYKDYPWIQVVDLSIRRDDTTLEWFTTFSR